MLVVSSMGQKTVCLQNTVCSVHLFVYVKVSRSGLTGLEKCPKKNDGFLDYSALYLLLCLLSKWTAEPHLGKKTDVICAGCLLCDARVSVRTLLIRGQAHASCFLNCSAVKKTNFFLL